MSMMKLMPHQQRIVDTNPRKALLNWEMRVGKTLPAVLWLKNHCNGKRVVVCMKQNKMDWLIAVDDARILICTKEEFKKIAPMICPSAIVIDEAHNFASPLFLRQGSRKRSQLSESLYALCKARPEMDVLLLTATPVRNDAWSLHTLLCYIGVYYDWKVWREEFFELKKMPFLKWPAWFPRKDWRERLRPYLEKHTDIVSLADIVEYLPPATTEIIKVSTPKYKPPEDEVVTWTDEHLWEQQNKGKAILELGYRKLIIAVNYTAQIDALARELSGDKPVFVLDGRTKDASAVKKAAQEASECYFICQSSMLMGFDGYMFGALVFASLSHSNVHHVQALGRQRHVEHLRPVVNYYLCGGRWDRRIMDSVFAGRDFNASLYE